MSGSDEQAAKIAPLSPTGAEIGFFGPSLVNRSKSLAEGTG